MEVIVFRERNEKRETQHKLLSVRYFGDILARKKYSSMLRIIYCGAMRERSMFILIPGIL